MCPLLLHLPVVLDPRQCRLAAACHDMHPNCYHQSSCTETDRGIGLQLYVAHLDPRAGEEDVRQLFSAHGAVMHVRIIQDRDTQQSKGYGFVTMGTPNMAQVGSPLPIFPK